MEISSTMTSKGQITIPRKLREALGLVAGDQLIFRLDEKQNVLLQKTPSKPSLAGILNDYRTGSPLSEDAIKSAMLRAMARYEP